MNAKEIPDWDTFEKELKVLRAKYTKPSSPLLFRGQGNSEWPLRTTLERSGASDMLFATYYQLCARIGPEVKTFAGAEVPNYLPNMRQDFGNTELFMTASEFLGRTLYPYMAYSIVIGLTPRLPPRSATESNTFCSDWSRVLSNSIT